VTTETVPQMPATPAAPTAGGTRAGSAQPSVAAYAELKVLRRGASRDPFTPLVKEPPPPGSDESSSSSSSGGGESSSSAATPAESAPPTMTTTAPTTGTPTPTPVPVQPLPPPTAAVLWTNGRRQIVGLAQAFKVADTSFHVDALSRKAVQISIPGAAFADGRRKVTIPKGHQLVLVNTATGVRYVVRFASGTYAAPTVGGANATSTPATTTQMPAAPTAPTTATAGATQ
jgi:hypothetical protein